MTRPKQLKLLTDDKMSGHVMERVKRYEHKLIVLLINCK